MDRKRWVEAALARHERPLVRYARRLTGDLDLARDIVQDCFLRLCRRRPAELDGHLVEWLYTVCRNRSLDHLRKRKRMAPVDHRQLADHAANGAAPDAQAAAGERAGLLARRLAELPGREREAVRLKFQEGLSYREIAAALQVSTSHVGVLLHTALRRLRARLGAATEGNER